jgi:hypothetical protein
VANLKQQIHVAPEQVEEERKVVVEKEEEERGLRGSDKDADSESNDVEQDGCHYDALDSLIEQNAGGSSQCCCSSKDNLQEGRIAENAAVT